MLYHVSIEEVEKFELRVPESRMKGENDNIGRICFSTSIEGALSAIPHNSEVLSGLLNLEYERKHVFAILNIYTLDESKLSLEQYYDTSYLMENNLVPDANLTNEVWVLTEDIVPTREIILLSDFRETYKRLEGTHNQICIIEHIDFKSLENDDRRIKETKDFWRYFREQYFTGTGKTISKNMLRSVISFFGRDSGEYIEGLEELEVATV